MYKTKEGSQNWAWASKEERDQNNANIMKEREPKLTKRRSWFRRDKDVKPIEQGTEEHQDWTANTNPNDSFPRMVDDGPQDTDVQMGDVDESNNQHDATKPATVPDQDTRLEQQFRSEQARTKATISGLQTSNELLEEHNWELQRRIEKLEAKTTDLEEENLGLRAAYEALRRSLQTESSPVPSHTAMLEAVNATIASRPPVQCQAYRGSLFKHTEPYVCENPEHSPFNDKVSCSACTEMTLNISDPRTQQVVRERGIVATICQRCCCSGDERLKAPCRCFTAKQCIMCVTKLVNGMAEDASKFEGKNLGKCLRCGKSDVDMANEEKVKVCVTCGGRRDE